MSTHDDPRAELIERCATIRHLRGEHGRAHDGTSARRHQEARLHDAIDDLERRLRQLVDEDVDREGWRLHAHGGPAPERPAPVPAREPRRTPERPTGRRPWPR